MPDENGKTRRERNESFDAASVPIAPPALIPPVASYIWNWYFSLSSSLWRIRDGICTPIPPSEFMAWKEATGEIVHPFEYAILRAMDAAFCAETNKELADYRVRQIEAQKAEIEAARPKGRR